NQLTHRDSLMGIPKALSVAALVILLPISGMPQDAVPSTRGSESLPPGTTRTLLFTAEPSNAELAAGDLELKQDGKPAPIVSIRNPGRIPVRYCLLVAISGSTTNDFDFEKKAVSVFLDLAIRPGVDHGWVILFNDAGNESTETSDPEPIKNAVSAAAQHSG